MTENMNYDIYGMPSGHMEFITFIALLASGRLILEVKQK